MVRASSCTCGAQGTSEVMARWVRRTRSVAQARFEAGEPVDLEHLKTLAIGLRDLVRGVGIARKSGSHHLDACPLYVEEVLG